MKKLFYFFGGRIVHTSFILLFSFNFSKGVLPQTIKPTNHLFTSIRNSTKFLLKGVLILLILLIFSLNPFHFSGLSDAEGCFHLNLDNKNRPRFSFSIGLNIKDEELIHLINSFFHNKGRISTYLPHHEIRITFENLDSINNYIIPHFDSYPLIGIKSFDYQLFKIGISLINKGEYKSSAGLQIFCEVALLMNEGYKINIIKLFPHLMEIALRANLRTKYLNSLSSNGISPPINPWWMTGFIDGDGSLSASVKYKNLGANGFKVVDPQKTRIAFQPSLSISQHKKNLILFNQIKEFFNSGNVYNKKASDGQYTHIQYKISSNKDIKSFIIPHFEKYPLISYKKHVYKIWYELIEILSNPPSENRNRKAIEFINEIKKLNNV